MEGLPKKPFQEMMEKKKDFKHIEDLLDKYPYAYNVEEILNSELGEEPSVEKEDLANEFYEYILERDLQREMDRIKSWEEEMKELKEKEKQEKIEILNILKKSLTDDFVENEYNFEREYHPLKDIKRDYAYWVDFAARKIANNYFANIRKSPKQKEYANILDEIKTYYYKEKNKPKFTESPDLKNFYEVEKEEDTQAIFDKFLKRDDNENRLDHSL